MAARAQRVALLCIDPWQHKGGNFRPFNYSVRKVQAAAAADPHLADVQLEVFESSTTNVDEFVERVERSNPDLIGASAYVWSFPTFIEVARRLKESRPERTILFGGPSARPEMFALPPYRTAHRYVDALVLGEGEEIFRELLALEDRSKDTLARVPGLALPTEQGSWVNTPERELPVLDTLASPYAAGLAPPGKTAHLETFRGCPLSCKFCQWGDLSKANRVFSVEYLVRELETFLALGYESAMLVDAALNLNPRAFRNLCAADKHVGFFRKAQLNTEVYPSHVTDEHLRFIAEVGGGVHIGLGLQSYDKAVLKKMERPFDEAKFDRVVADLLPLAPRTNIEIIMGLPGDNPDSFRRTIERASKLGAGMRVFRCLVLPNALMSRSPADFDMAYDPVTLRMLSCLGWSVKDLDAMCVEMDALVRSVEGAWRHDDDNGWSFPSAEERASSRVRIAAEQAQKLGAAQGGELTTTTTTRPGGAPAGDAQDGEPVPPPLHDAIARCVERATSAGWTLVRAGRGSERELRVRLALGDGGGELVLDVAVARGAPSYRVLDGVAYSYRGNPGAAALKHLDAVVHSLRRLMHIVLLGSAKPEAPAPEESTAANTSAAPPRTSLNVLR